jgi:membrane protease YdiL (CAAX protease family)
MAVEPGIADERPARRSSWVARHEVAAFLFLSFALSWWVWPLTWANPDSVAMLPVGPLIAAFAVAALAGGRGEVTDLLRAIVRWNVRWRWYVVALAGPFAVVAVTGVTLLLLGVVESNHLREDYGWSTWMGLPLLLLSTGLLGGPLFEEVGWRGFLLPRLQQRHTALLSTAVVAGVWATWHLPLLVSEPTGQRPPLPFIVWILAQAVLLTWLYNSTGGSVLLAILFHTAVNSASRILLEPFLGEDGFLALWWLMAALYVLAAALVVWLTQGRLGLKQGAATGSTRVGDAA